MMRLTVTVVAVLALGCGSGESPGPTAIPEPVPAMSALQVLEVARLWADNNRVYLEETLIRYIMGIDFGSRVGNTAIVEAVEVEVIKQVQDDLAIEMRPSPKTSQVILLTASAEVEFEIEPQTTADGIVPGIKAVITVSKPFVLTGTDIYGDLDFDNTAPGEVEIVKIEAVLE